MQSSFCLRQRQRQRQGEAPCIIHLRLRRVSMWAAFRSALYTCPSLPLPPPFSLRLLICLPSACGPLTCPSPALLGRHCCTPFLKPFLTSLVMPWCQGLVLRVLSASARDKTQVRQLRLVECFMSLSKLFLCSALSHRHETENAENLTRTFASSSLFIASNCFLSACTSLRAVFLVSPAVLSLLIDSALSLLYRASQFLAAVSCGAARWHEVR